MGDHAHDLTGHAVREDSLTGKAPGGLEGSESGPGNVQEQNVRHHLGGIDLHSGNFGQSLRQKSGIFVIHVQALGSLLEGHETRGRENACLAHATTQHLPYQARLLDELLAAHQQGADRRAQPFRKAEHHGVKLPRELDDGMP